MATKFSDFTAQAATGTTFVVGYDGTTNTQYSQDNLTNFVLDGTLSAARTLKLDGNNLDINYGTGNVYPIISAGKFAIYPNGTSTALSQRAAFSSGNIDFNYLGHNANSIGINFTSYNTGIRGYGFGMYGGGAWSNNGGYSVIGPNFTYTSGNALTARLGVIGVHNDNTSYAFRVQNSDLTDIFSVNNDGTFALGKGASYTNSTPNTSVIIGNSALVTSNNSVVIGASATTVSGGQSGVIVGANASFAANNSFGVAIGANANVTGTNGTAIGYSSKAGGNGLAIGRDAEATGNKSITLSASGAISQNTSANTFDVYMSDASTPDFKVVGAEGMVPPSITTTVRDAISSPNSGSTIYNTTDNKLQFYNGTAWTDAGGGDNIYTADGTIGASRVATITDFPKFSGTQPNPIGLELENTQTGSGAMSTMGAQLKMTSNSATGTIGYFNSGSGGSNAPAMVLDSPGRIVYTAAVDAGHMFQLAHGDFRFLNDAGQNYPIFESIVAGGGSNYSEFRLAKTGNTYSYIRSVQNDANNIFSVGRTVSGTYGEAIRINQANQLGINSDGMTIGAQLHVKGAGLTNGTTAFLVEDSDGNDIIKALDDRTVRLGYNANQITTESNSGGTVKLNNVNGDPLFSASVVAGSTGKINVYGGYYNTFEYAASKGLVFTNEAGFSVPQDLSSMLTCISSTKGFLPPRMTTTQRDAINSGTFTTGLTLYNTTDNKLQFYNGTAWTDAGGGDNIYTADGTLSGNRLVNFNSNTLQLGNQGTDGEGVKIFQDGRVQIPKYSGSFKVVSYGTQLRQNFLRLYTNTTLGATITGFTTLAASSNWTDAGTGGDSFSINARLGIIGKSATSTTDYAFRVQDSAATDMVTVRDDGAIALGKGAVIQSTSNPQYSVVIGYGAKDKASAGNGVEAVAIGRLANGHQNGVAIGGIAKCLGASAVAIGAQAEAKATGVSIGVQAGGASAGSSAVSIGKFAQAKANGAIAIGANTGLTGANSIVLNATTGVTSTTTADTFDVFMTSSSAPDLKFKTGDNQSYWNPGGETSAFGFSTTTPTATVDINGTFRLRSASNVSNQILTADANGNATWSNSLNLNGQVKGGYESGVTTLAFNWDNGNIQKSSATGAQTFSGSNAIAGSTYIIMIGTPTVTWGSSVKWPGGTAPTLAGTTNIITLLYDGTSYYATSVLNYS